MTASASQTADTNPDNMRIALELRAITKTFGGFVALDSADFALRSGEVHALLGENGAGKSTLMNVAAGIYKPDSGTVSVHGTPTLIDGPTDAQALGIGMVHQHYKLVRPFSALQNILLANPGGSYRTALARLRREAGEMAAALGFEVDLDARIHDLSIADQQRVEILRTLLAGARIVILDEPTAVLTDAESERLFAAVRRMTADGRSVVLVTHKLHEALNYADRITVMRGGKVEATVLPGEVDVSSLTKMIVGTQITRRKQPSSNVGAVVLDIEDIAVDEVGRTPALNGVSLSLRSGEIYGLAGVGGNGQEEFVEALMGLRSLSRGRVVLDGARDITGAGPARLRRIGFAWIPSDRQRHALAGALPVVDNFSINGILSGRYSRRMGLSMSDMRQETRSAVEKFEVAGVRSLRQKAALLSGGNAQKLVIAREFSSAPRIVIAHSPSRGLDVRASAAVHDNLRAARDRGAAVLVISEDLDEILVLADRIGVISRGRVVAEFDEPDRLEIGKAMIGHA